MKKKFAKVILVLINRYVKGLFISLRKAFRLFVGHAVVKIKITRYNII